MLFIQTADHAVIGALQYLDDLGFRAAAPVHAALPHHHHIAVQHLVHFLLAEEHIWPAVFRDQETVAIRMALYLALDQIELFHDADIALAIAHDLAVALHRAQAARKQIFLAGFNMQ